MKNYIIHDEWKIIEEGFHPEFNKISESIFSLGNGRWGGRGNFEEQYTGSSLQGNYVAGVYYPDKTRVGWWKNGYPEYFAKVLNAANWNAVHITVDGVELDLAKQKIESFRRELDMKQGLLTRSFTVSFENGKQVEINSSRFMSMERPEIAVVRYAVKPLNFAGNFDVKPLVDFDVKNEDSNYNEKFWVGEFMENIGNEGYLAAHTKKTNFLVCSGMKFMVTLDGLEHAVNIENYSRDKYISSSFNLHIQEGSEMVLYKFAVCTTSEYFPKLRLINESKDLLNEAFEAGYQTLLEEHLRYWAQKWETGDITIKGDVAAQQGIRFNIFQLNQTYTGDDERLNIGPKGFTGEKYGGTTYWDTEAFCFTFYLATAPRMVARNLLLYRYKHLQKAIENAQKLGFKNGAALYPMVTINGEECHNEWEITFEEIHRNGAIAYAISQYVNYAGDKSYLVDYGLEVLIALSRFWRQRVSWSEERHRFVILGVTGPNEYENNVNNNWYTNKMAVWTLDFAIKSIHFVKEFHPQKWNDIVEKCVFDENNEVHDWELIIEKMYFPWDEQRRIFLQQDGFLDKELVPVSEINPIERPISHHWSWDRILRSPYIKQADVLQGLYFFEQEYSKDLISRHFDFYEPFTVHESSLSPCVHTILAAATGKHAKAYEMYLRASRLDLDDYNSDTSDGLHITSMGGTWMAIVLGFGGLRVRDGHLCLNPTLPSTWDSFSFRIDHRDVHLEIRIEKSSTSVTNFSKKSIDFCIWERSITLKGECTSTFEKI
jgi:maltose phosphorylase